MNQSLEVMNDVNVAENFKFDNVFDSSFAIAKMP